VARRPLVDRGPGGGPCFSQTAKPSNADAYCAPIDGTPTVHGVRLPCSTSSASKAEASRSIVHGSGGGWPSTSSKTRATHSPSSTVPLNSATGRPAGSAAATRTWRRYNSGASGFWADDTALMKHRLP
jgi:hypothetical protein